MSKELYNYYVSFSKITEDGGFWLGNCIIQMDEINSIESFNAMMEILQKHEEPETEINIINWKKICKVS